MEIIEYSSNRAKAVADLFFMSVHAIDHRLYSAEQKKAWAPLPIDYVYWMKRLELKRPYLLLIDEQLAGFIELESDGHIDCAYVAPTFQRKGVASALLQHVINKAKTLKLKRLYVEASIVAKPFFEQSGFILVTENSAVDKVVIRKGVALTHYSMQLILKL